MSPPPEDPSWDFDAFISYSTLADYRMAHELEAFLESFHQQLGIKEFGLKPLRICVDGSDFRLPRKVQGRSPRGSVESEPIKNLIRRYLERSGALLILWPGSDCGTSFMDWELTEFVAQNERHGWHRPVRVIVTRGEDPARDADSFFSSTQIALGVPDELYFDFRAKNAAANWQKIRDFDRERMRLAVDLVHPKDSPGGRKSVDDYLPGWRREQLRKARKDRRNAMGVAAFALALAVFAGIMWRDALIARGVAERKTEDEKLARAATEAELSASRYQSALGLFERRRNNEMHATLAKIPSKHQTWLYRFLFSSPPFCPQRVPEAEWPDPRLSVLTSKNSPQGLTVAHKVLSSVGSGAWLSIVRRQPETFLLGITTGTEGLLPECKIDSYESRVYVDYAEGSKWGVSVNSAYTITGSGYLAIPIANAIDLRAIRQSAAINRPGYLDDPPDDYYPTALTPLPRLSDSPLAGAWSRGVFIHEPEAEQPGDQRKAGGYRVELGNGWRASKVVKAEDSVASAMHGTRNAIATHHHWGSRTGSTTAILLPEGVEVVTSDSSIPSMSFSFDAPMEKTGESGIKNWIGFSPDGTKVAFDPRDSSGEWIVIDLLTSRKMGSFEAPYEESGGYWVHTSVSLTNDALYLVFHTKEKNVNDAWSFFAANPKTGVYELVEASGGGESLGEQDESEEDSEPEQDPQARADGETEETETGRPDEETQKDTTDTSVNDDFNVPAFTRWLVDDSGECVVGLASGLLRVIQGKARTEYRIAALTTDIDPYLR